MGIKARYKLKGRTKLKELMARGKRIKAFPLHLVFLPYDGMPDSPDSFEIAVTAPKRIHRRAVDRNLLKRRLREAFRPLIPEMETFIKESGTAYVCMLIYVGSEKQSVSSLKPRLNLLLQRFKEECNTLQTDEQNQERTP